MNPSRSPEKGEVLKLGPPASGEVIVVVDPSSTGTTFAAGTETLLPGAEIPVHKHLDQDEVLFVHKGQGRATLNERSIVVIPGAMLSVPRGAWHGLRNVGTGVLQIAWVSAPPGMEAFFRDLSRAGVSPSAQALQELAQRHGIEFRQATDAPMPALRRRRRRHGGRRDRGGRGPARPGSSKPAVMPPSARVEPSSATPVAPGMSGAPSTAPAAPAASSAPHGRRRRRHRRGGAGQRSTPPAAAQGRRKEAGGAASVSAPTPISAPAPTPGSARPGAGGQRSARGHRSRRVKEVYMGGRWVRVEGEGSVIAPGPKRRGPNRGDDEPPATRLSVPL